LAFSTAYRTYVESEGDMAKSRAVCECTGCGQKFITEVAFNLHRTGSFGKPTRLPSGVTTYSKHERKCMNVEEMKQKGLSLKDRGLWTTSIIDTDEVSSEQEKEGMEV